MSTSEDTNRSNRKRPPLVMCIFPLLIGLAMLSRVMVSPQFESYRTMHVVQLIVAGAGFGVAWTILMFAIVRRNN